MSSATQNTAGVVPGGSDQQPRVRRWAPKVRTGCTTCRIRRVKCDETKPACLRCITTGRQCDGYESSEVAPPGLTQYGQLAPGPNIHGSVNVLENRAFDFFRTHTTFSVAAYRGDPTWCRIVLQAGHAASAVWHAAIALGALHEERLIQQKAETRDDASSSAPSTFCVAQYCKALQGLQELLKLPKVPWNLVLLSSLVLIHFEALRGESDSALNLIENALRTLHFNNDRGSEKPNVGLLRALLRMDDQGFLRKGMALSEPVLVFDLSEVSQDLPDSFVNLAQAKDLITTWICCQCHFMLTQAHIYKFQAPGDIPLEVVGQLLSITESFRELEARLETAFTSSTPRELSTSNQHGVAMLKAWTVLATIIGATSSYAEASVYDLYLNDFARIVDLCSSVLEADEVLEGCSVVSIDEGILHPLFFTAIQCRDGRIRRRALSLLELLPRDAQIVWDIDAVTDIARFCVDFEEAQFGESDDPTCQDILEWKRIHNVTLELVQNQGSKRLLSARLWLRANGMDGEWTSIVRHIQLRHKLSGRGKKYVPVNPFGVWWENTRPTTMDDDTPIVKGEALTFDTTPYRRAYLEQLKMRLESEYSGQSKLTQVETNA